MKTNIILCLFLLSAFSLGAEPGKVMFSEIKQLPKKWWRDPQSVWTVWDNNTYYLWGANLRNYKITDSTLGGSGMASPDGPSRGRGHPHYVGVITTSLSFVENDLIFSFLEERLEDGADIVIPVCKGRFALGTGVAFLRYATIQNWYESQHYLFKKIRRLTKKAKEIEIAPGTFWPDCGLTKSTNSVVNISIQNIDDIKELMRYLNDRF